MYQINRDVNLKFGKRGPHTHQKHQTPFKISKPIAQIFSVSETNKPHCPHPKTHSLNPSQRKPSDKSLTPLKQHSFQYTSPNTFTEASLNCPNLPFALRQTALNILANVDLHLVYISPDSALSSCQIQSEGWGVVEGLGIVTWWEVFG